MGKCGPKPSKVRRRVRALVRYSPTSSYITCSTCGSINGENGTRTGRIIIVRYADDFVMGAQYEADARKMMVALRERLAAFGLMLHEEKTRLLEFGRLSTERREARGDRRPETFTFLGFTHYCARSRDGRFVVKRRTDRKRFTRKLHTVRTEQRRRMHTPLAVQHRWLCGILRGHYRYFGLPSNSQALNGSTVKSVGAGFARFNAEASGSSRGTGSISGSSTFLFHVRALSMRGSLSLADSDPPREEPSAGNRMLGSVGRSRMA